MVKHFGLNHWPDEQELTLTRDNYLEGSKKTSFSYRLYFPNTYIDDLSNVYSEEWIEQHCQNCLTNFDINMRYFASLNHNDFEKEVSKFVKKQKFTPCSDLFQVNDVEGFYLMVLDQYSHAYIGTSTNIKRRIMQHWSRKLPCDRLLFPMNGITSSKISIDSFRPLDTTRIYYRRERGAINKENWMVNQFPEKYLCNRIPGGPLLDIKLNEGFIIPRQINPEESSWQKQSI